MSCVQPVNARCSILFVIHIFQILISTIHFLINFLNGLKFVFLFTAQSFHNLIAHISFYLVSETPRFSFFSLQRPFICHVIKHWAGMFINLVALTSSPSRSPSKADSIYINHNSRIPTCFMSILNVCLCVQFSREHSGISLLTD